MLFKNKKIITMFIVLMIVNTTLISCGTKCKDINNTTIDNNTEIKEKDISDKELLDIIQKGNLLVPEILLSAKEYYKNVNEKDYYLMPEQYNSKEKIENVLKEYWTDNMINKLSIPIEKIDNITVLPYGQIGNVPDWSKAIIKNKEIIDENNIKVSVTFSVPFSDDFDFYFKNENKSWKIYNQEIKSVDFADLN